MARVSGPLMSVEASGTYAKTLTFAKWKGRPYVRERVIPLNPKSAKQTGVRAMMGFLGAAWAAISTNNRATWAAAAAAKSISEFNEYISANLKRWQAGDAPSQASPAAEASSALTITTQTATGGSGAVTLAITPSAGTSIWGYIIYRDTAEITAPSWMNAAAVIAADGANQVTYVDSPLPAATYHYRVAAINTDGKIGTIHADGAAVAS